MTDIERRRRASERQARYRRTKRGFIGKMYMNMMGRVKGRTKDAHIYEGLELLSRTEFVVYALNDPTFNILWEDFVDSGYERKLAPTPDRVDPSLGYTIDNIDFVTLSTNVRNRFI